jgi:hypothetical protein
VTAIGTRTVERVDVHCSVCKGEGRASVLTVTANMPPGSPPVGATWLCPPPGWWVLLPLAQVDRALACRCPGCLRLGESEVAP